MVTDALFDLAEFTPCKPEPVYSVHCFFNCGHVTRASDPKTSGDAMEQHYGEAHDSDIDRALGIVGARRHPAAAQQPKEADNPRTVCVCGHTRGEHATVSGRLLCDACDGLTPDACKEFEAL